MSENPKRRRLTAEENLRILEDALQPGVRIAELPERHGISTSQFYGWRGRPRQGGKAVLSQPLGRKGRNRDQEELQRLRAERDRLRAVVNEITTENLELLKNA